MSGRLAAAMRRSLPDCATRADRDVLTELALTATDQTRRVWIGERSMLDALGYSRSGLYRALARLRDFGLVQGIRVPRAGVRQEYVLLVPPQSLACPTHPGCRSAPRERAELPRESGARITGQPDRLAPVGRLARLSSDRLRGRAGDA